MMKEYFKVVGNEKVYYIGTALKDRVDEEFFGLKPEFGEKWYELKLLQFSDFVIDTRTNQLLKCRYMLEDIFDQFTGVGAER